MKNPKSECPKSEQGFKKLFFILIVIWCLGFGISYALPTIANEEVTTLTDTTAIITWTTTNELSDTKVYCGASFPDPLTPKYSSAESTYYHYAVLNNLLPGTTYQYFVSSGALSTSSDIRSFTTLTPPPGTYLFSFATISDLQYADGKLDTFGARGRPYSKSAQILDAMVASINKLNPSFTIIKGDVIESSVVAGDSYFPYGDDVLTVGSVPKYAGQENIITKLSRLSTPTWYPIPGNHDKAASYTGGNWVLKNLGALYPAMAGTNPNVDSDFNYSFVSNGYRFIMLDSVRISDLKAEVNIAYLTAQLAAAQAAGQKCFVFLHHPATDVRSEGIPDTIINEVAGTSDYTKIQIMNSQEVQSLITGYKNIVAGVFSGHIHDNKYSEISGVPYVRTSAGIQFPTSYHVYKVYSNGFIQSTYKVPNWTEIARNVVSPESGYSDIYWEQFSLGSGAARNFSHTMANLPPEVVISKIVPSVGDSNVPVNENIVLVFSKSMNPADTQASLTINPALSNPIYKWENNNQILVVTHDPFAQSTSYNLTIGISAKDSQGTSLASAFSYSFDTGSSTDTVPPSALFDHFQNDVTIDNQPVITGTATDQASAIVSIECRVDNGAWSAATALDGLFNGKTELFSWTPPQALTRGITSHEVAVRCLDAAGNINTSYVTMGFYVISDRPEIELRSRGTTIINGDVIDKNPSFDITIITNKPPVTAQSLSPTVSSINLTADLGNAYIFSGNYAPTLNDGKYDIKIEAVDSNNRITTKEVIDLVVQTAAELAVQGIPLNYPNPFNPEKGATSISYTLSKPADITLTIYDLMGNQILKKNYVTGTMGGKAGYNEVAWDGRDTGGTIVGNGIYIYLIVGDGRVLAKGKLTVLK